MFGTWTLGYLVLYNTDMANSANVIGKFSEEVTETAKEVVKDVKDEFGQILEQGGQAIAGTQLTPQQIQPFDSAQGRQKQAEDQKKLIEARRKIAFYQQTAQAQQKVRMENQQKEMQRQQTEKQEAEAKKIEKIQMQQAPKRPGLSEAVLRSQAEYKPGKGVGG